MAEYIEREALLELYDMGEELEEYAEVLRVPIPVIRQNIKDIPAADVVSVVHGRWIRRANEKKCSVCGFIYYSNNDEWSWCPNCGARMDGE